MKRNIDFIETLSELSQNLVSDPYTVKSADLTDLGNEIGYQLGHIVKNMSKDDIEMLIRGLKHGISLTNGGHL